MHNPVHIKALTPAPARRYDVIGRRLVRSGGAMSGYRSAMRGPGRALDRLRRAAATRELDALCRRHGVTLLVAFGSAVRGTADPHDLDLAVAAEDLDIVGLLDELTELTGFDGIDLMDLRRAGPVAMHRSLVGGEVLFQATSGLFEERRDGAVLQYMDTRGMRREQLELLAR